MLALRLEAADWAPPASLSFIAEHIAPFLFFFSSYRIVVQMKSGGGTFEKLHTVSAVTFYTILIECHRSHGFENKTQVVINCNFLFILRQLKPDFPSLTCGHTVEQSLPSFFTLFGKTLGLKG